MIGHPCLVLRDNRPRQSSHRQPPGAACVFVRMLALFQKKSAGRLTPQRRMRLYVPRLRSMCVLSQLPFWTEPKAAEWNNLSGIATMATLVFTAFGQCTRAVSLFMLLRRTSPPIGSRETSAPPQLHLPDQIESGAIPGTFGQRECEIPVGRCRQLSPKQDSYWSEMDRAHSP